MKKTVIIFLGSTCLTATANAQVSAEVTVSAICNDGQVMSWGYNQYNQVSASSTTTYNAPEAMPALSSVKDISVGGYHSLAVTQTGELYSWGFNNSGQLGNGTNYAVPAPQLVMGVSNLTAVEAGGSQFSLALQAGGTVLSWGSYTSNCLGDGSTSNRLSPQIISSLNNITQIEAGNNTAFAIDADGNLFGWGENGYGQMGLGHTTDVSIPVFILDSVVRVAAGLEHTLVVRMDGTVWSWGRNDRGQLATGDTMPKLLPHAISGLSNMASVAAGNAFSIALKSDGTVWGWGFNVYGQLGISSTSTSTACLCEKVPVQTLISSVSEITAGSSTGLARKMDGTLYSWGDNSVGSLGNGGSSGSSVPVQVTGLCPLILDVEDNKLSATRSFPNPCTSRLTLEGDGLRDKTMTLLNVLGQEQAFTMAALTDERAELDLRNARNGIYLLRIAGSEGIEVIRIVKE
jgi:hypothetical protein